MDIKPGDGHRTHFNILATTTPKLLISEGTRWAMVLVNSGSGNIRIGYSGSLASMGMVIPASQGFTDNYTRDEYWVMAESGSGTVTGFVVS